MLGSCNSSDFTVEQRRTRMRNGENERVLPCPLPHNGQDLNFPWLGAARSAAIIAERSTRGGRSHHRGRVRSLDSSSRHRRGCLVHNGRPRRPRGNASWRPNGGLDHADRRVRVGYRGSQWVSVRALDQALPRLIVWLRSAIFIMVIALGLRSALSALRSRESDLVEASEQLRLVINELEHRGRNALAIVHALTNETARSANTVAEYHEQLGARLIALSTSTLL